MEYRVNQARGTGYNLSVPGAKRIRNWKHMTAFLTARQLIEEVRYFLSEHAWLRRAPSVLVLGVYLADRKNHVQHIVRELSRSLQYRVIQKWICIGGGPPDREVERVTVDRIVGRAPKFVLMNRLLTAHTASKFEFVLLCDDDILLPTGFIDNFLGFQNKYDFALAQPARTPGSNIDHAIVKQAPGVKARHTRFVEIGPVVSIRRDMLPLITPFDESTPMGWGLDYIWPVIAENNGLRLGIVDATPVDHSLRPAAAAYSGAEAQQAQDMLLSRVPHLSYEEAYQVLDTYRN